MKNVVAGKVQSIPCGNHAIDIHLRVYGVITHKLNPPVIFRIALDDDIEELKHGDGAMVASTVLGSAASISGRTQ